MSEFKKKHCSCLCFSLKKHRNKSSKPTNIDCNPVQGPFPSPKSERATIKSNSLSSALIFQPKVISSVRKKSLEINFPKVFKAPYSRNPFFSPRENLNYEFHKDQNMKKNISLPKMAQNSISPRNLNSFNNEQMPDLFSTDFKAHEKTNYILKNIDQDSDFNYELSSRKDNIKSHEENDKRDEESKESFLVNSINEDFGFENGKNSEKSFKKQELIISSPNYTQISPRNLSPKGIVSNVSSDILDNLLMNSKNTENGLSKGAFKSSMPNGCDDISKDENEEDKNGMIEDEDKSEEFGQQFSIANGKGLNPLYKCFKLPPLKPITPHYFNRRKRNKSDTISDAFTYA